MTEDTLKRLLERIDPTHSEELARLYYEACEEAVQDRPDRRIPSIPWDRLPLDRRTLLTDAMRGLLTSLLEKPHLWTVKYDLVVCARCSVVRRRDSKNPPCPGNLPGVLPR